jgi:hypothetical protein
MFHYFAIAVTITALALLTAASLGIARNLGLLIDSETHFLVALIAAILAIGTNTMLIVFMIVTGRILREAVRARDLPLEFLDQLNVFFADKAAYPAAIGAAFSIVVAGVLAFAGRHYELSVWVHGTAGVLALGINLAVIPIELSALKANQRLVDRAANALNKIDAGLEERGELPEEEPLQPAAIARSAWIVAISAWMPWGYWGLVEYRGDFGRASIHPWIEISILAALVGWMATRAARDEREDSDGDAA